MTNLEFEERRNKAVARAIAFSSTFVADRAENAEVWDVEGQEVHPIFAAALAVRMWAIATIRCWQP